MKKLSHAEMLALPESEECSQKDNEKILSDFLVRRLYGKKLSDFELTEPFIIEANIAALKITENGSELSSSIAPTTTLIEMFNHTNRVQEQIKSARAEISRLKGPGMMQMAKNAMGAAKRFAKSGFAMVPDDEFKRRTGICASCEFWDASARMGMGKCLKCGCTSTKFRMAAEKCPLDKWEAISTS